MNYLKTIVKFTLIYIFILVFSACGVQKFSIKQKETTSVFENNVKSSQYKDWTDFNKEQAFIKEYFFNEQGRAQLVVVKFKKHNYKFNILEDRESPKTMAAWQDTYKNVDLIVNGSFFDESYKPTGGMILNGQGRIYSEDGSNLYEGAVVINEKDELKIKYLPKNNLSVQEKGQNVLVSFPYLIHQGKIVFDENINKEKEARTLIGSDNEYIYFIISKFNLFTLSDLVVWVNDEFSEIQEVLNLDGGSSSSLSVLLEKLDKKYLINSLTRIPNVITASLK